MDLNAIAAAFATHNYLVLVLMLAVYLRTLFSDESKFPKTWNPNWRPLFVGVASAVVVEVTAHDAGQTWGMATLSAVAGLIGGGFLDGMAVAIFGTTEKAPSWARWLVMAVDGAFGRGGGLTVKKTETQTQTTEVSVKPAADAPPPAPKVSARLALVLGVLAIVAILGALVFHASGPFAPSAHPAPVAVVLQDDGRIAYVEPMIADVQTSECSSARAVAPVALEGCTNGQLNPQAVTVGTNVIALLGCGLVVYARDTTTSPINWGTVALDLAASCGMDVEDIINDFGASSPVAVAAAGNTANVHASAAAFKAKKLTTPPAGG
jgi:hypothetical protein